MSLQVSIIEQLHLAFKVKTQKLIQRKVAHYQRLAAKDPFEMTDEQAKWHHSNLKDLGDEILMLNEFQTMNDQYREAWSIQIDKAENNWDQHAKHCFNRAKADADFWRQYYFEAQQCAIDYLNISISNLQSIKK